MRIYPAGALAIILLLLFVFSSAAQQAPVLLVTWQAESYAPPEFLGKVLPTANTKVSAALTLIGGSRVADLSREEIFWYLDGELIASGLGARRAAFRAPDRAGGSFDLRAEIPRHSSGALLKTVVVPIARPEAVIVAPLPENRLYSEQIELKGGAYFFNVTDPAALTFGWQVNGEFTENEENPERLSLTVPPGTPSGKNISVTLGIQNPRNLFEGAIKRLNITFIRR